MSPTCLFWVKTVQWRWRYQTSKQKVYLSSGAVVLKVGVEKSKLIYCQNCRERLPNKLGELLSSMYLVATISSAKYSCAKKSIEIYGWLLLRSTLSIGVKLTITTLECNINILWMTSNTEENMARELRYYLNVIT